MLLLSRINCVNKYCKKFIEKYYKYEAAFFDDIWEIYEPEIKEYIKGKAKKWPLRIPKNKLVCVLGISDPTQMPDLMSTKIINAIAEIERNIMWRLMSIEFIPKKNEIEEIIKKSLSDFKLSSDVKSNLIKFVYPLYISDILKISKILKKEEIRIIIIERGEPVDCSEKNIAERKNKREQYDVWIFKTYRSDKKDEVLIKKGQLYIRDQSLRLLICLLKATGRLCGYSEVFREAWNEAKESSKAYERRKIVQSWKELRKNEFLNNNIEVVQGKGFFVKEGVRNHCIIYSTQLNAKE